ncbi:ubiquinone/menaquinone biosynthesis C-methylase UbiE [Runella defluvii]|uniref:Ubiquinone/menaquinone biosynthesis C-methylase UbiE n=1 Tax=Runella defluvii TaxID=370973 RepID=A0A7W5ZMK3_9BACT|nr:class I SAM-dependent methyltransferase [Runella defluvii]MBB3839603.1 ubiquinone/menaquinone biosynthesis C-methylase UbiE [Runella defluvii]
MTQSDYKEKYFLNPSIKYNGYASYPIRLSIRKAIEELKNKIEGEVIDIGCGVMPYKELLIQNNKISKYTGIDWEGGSYEHISKPDLYWDGRKIPLSDNSVDWVIATEILEHYFDTKLILDEIKRVLKPGGKLFFTVPFVMTLHEVPYDEFRFTPFSLQKYFELVGYSKYEIKPLGGINFSLAIMYGNWVQNKSLCKVLRKILPILLHPFYVLLIKKDLKTEFINSAYPSGLFGFVEK